MRHRIACAHLGKMGRTALFAVAMLQASTAIVHANLLVNGSFETPVIPPATFLDFGIGGEPAGFAWTVTTNTVDIVSNGFLGGTAFDGVQWLDLVGFGSTGGIEQTFVTTPGQQYTLFFAYANNPGPGVPVPVSADVTVTSGADTLLNQSISHGTSTTSGLDWTPFSMTLTATGTSATLAFDETVGGANGGVFLDAVSINATTAPVPEPTAIILLATGLAALSLVRRRKEWQAHPHM
jgi:hypothetical protein